MLIAGHFFYLQLLLLLFSQAQSIRPLKQGRMIDAAGREYKSPRYESKGVERTTYSQVDGSPPVRIECTESSMTIQVNPAYFKRGKRVSFGELFLGEAQHWQNSKCQLLPANGQYVITVQLQECGSNSTVKQCVTCIGAVLLDQVNHFECIHFSAGSRGLSDLLEQAVSRAGFKAP